jgi:hypothetical protein
MRFINREEVTRRLTYEPCIPIAAWGLMLAIAVCRSFLIGYGARRTSRDIFLILPVMVPIAFCLISEIYSPIGGVIHVAASNLVSLSQSLHSR